MELLGTSYKVRSTREGAELGGGRRKLSFDHVDSWAPVKHLRTNFE